MAQYYKIEAAGLASSIAAAFRTSRGNISFDQANTVAADAIKAMRDSGALSPLEPGDDPEAASMVLTATVDVVRSMSPSVSSANAGDVFASTYAAIMATYRGAAPSPVSEQTETLVPPVPIKKSITPDHLVSLEDGQRYKSLKRHLAGKGLTPEQYRTKWGLPGDYPMVAPNYAKQRSDLAKSMGLGRKRAAK
jgi:predicted transcriptional regulator